MKFQKGDKVIALELDYFQNPFHNDKCIREMTVKDADEGHFSPYYEKYDRFFSGSNLYSIFKQETGVAMYGGEKVYHKEKDKEIIKELIDKAISEYEERCKKDDLERVSQLEKTIEIYQEEIEEIKKGNGIFYRTITRDTREKYKEKVLTKIKKVFNF